MSSIDPVTTEIIRNAFISIANDMNATLIRSALTPIIYEGKDCSAALLDERGEVLGQSLGLPLFLGNLAICVRIIAAARDDIFQQSARRSGQSRTAATRPGAAWTTMAWAAARCLCGLPLPCRKMR